MSFRRDHDASLKWKRWLERNRDELLACGVPMVVLETREHWYYFVGHGYFTLSGLAEPIINVDNMERDKAERLCDFLETSACNYPDSPALWRLRYLLKRGPGHQEVMTQDQILAELSKSDRWGINCQPEDVGAFARVLAELPVATIKMNSSDRFDVVFTRPLSDEEAKGLFEASDCDDDPVMPDRLRALLWWD